MLFLAQASEGFPAGYILIYIFALFAIVYFLFMRPQRHREKERREMLKAIKKNDRVLTSGGIYGIVTSVGENEVTLKIDEANNVRVRFTLQAITGIIRQGEKKESVKT